MGLFSGRLILGVKNNLRNAWAYFPGGGLFSGFYDILNKASTLYIKMKKSKKK